MVVFSPLFSVQALGGSLTFSAIATHPQAAAQTTSRGKTINKLEFFNGKLYSGFGDYNANTGPIAINPLNTTTHIFDGVQVTVPTEEVNQFRILGSKIYAPMIDPTCALTCSAGYAVGEPWSNTTPIQAEHLFDMASLNGTDLWLVGSFGDNISAQDSAGAWRSTDGGTTWNLIQQDTDTATPGTFIPGFERYYWAATLNGKVYMQADGVYPAAPVRSFDGSSWTQGITQEIAPGDTHVVTFDGNIITQENGLSAFNGATLSSITSKQTYDLYVNGSYLYVLYTDGTIYRTADLTNWQLLGTAPSTARSLAVSGSNIYLGTTDSKIYQSDQTIPAAPSVDISAIQAVGTFANGSDTFQAVISDPDSIVNQVVYELTNINDPNIGALTSSSSSPYGVTLNTSNLAEGTYILKVSARDQNGLTADQKQTVIKLSHVVTSNGSSATVITPVTSTKQARTAALLASAVKTTNPSSTSDSSSITSTNPYNKSTSPVKPDLLTATIVTTHKKWSVNTYEKLAGGFFVAGLFTIAYSFFKKHS